MADGTAPSAPIDLTALFDEHRHGLAGAARAIVGSGTDLREVVQEAFLRAWRAWSRGERPRDSVGWIYVVLLNTARDWRRRRQHRIRSVSLDEVATMDLTTSGPAPGAGLLRQEAVAAARTAIERLPESEKDVFLLRVSGDLTFAATAAALGIPVGTAKTRMRTALAHLRETLAAHDPGAKERQ